MKYLLLSDDGNLSGLAWKLQMEGHSPILFIKNKEYKRKLEGMVPHVATIRDGLAQTPEIIIWDLQDQDEALKALRGQGWKVLGGGELAQRLQNDTKFMNKAMDSFGVKIPKSYFFPCLKYAIEFAQSHKQLMTFKFQDETQSFLNPQNSDDLISYMEHLKGELKLDGKVWLEEFIDGPHVSTTIWYSNGKPLAQPYTTLETTKFMPWDVGLSSDCQTSVTFAYPKREPKIIQQSFKKLHILMERMGYTGPLTIKGMVKKNRFYALSVDTSFTQVSILGMLELLGEQLGDFLARIANGDTSTMKFKEGYAYTLKVSVPPYPMTSGIQALDQVVEGLTADDWKTSAVPTGVRFEKEKIYTSSPDGIVLECTGYAIDLFSAEKIAFATFKKIRLANKQARLGDGAKTALRRINMLSKQGYEMPPFEMPTRAFSTTQETLVSIAS